jgi:hypothetical protein
MTINDIILWLGAALQIAVVAVMWRRRLYRRLPTFFWYLVFQVIRVATTPLIGHDYGLYFWTYWWTELISWAWGLAVIQEVMQRLFEPYAAVRRLIAVLFGWAAALLVAFAALSAYIAPGGEPERLMAAIFVFERSVRVVQVGLLSLLFVVANFLRLRWPRHALGVALGYTVFCTVELAVLAGRAQAGPLAWQTFEVLKPLSFVLALLVWLVYVSLPERSPAREPGSAPQMEGWDSALAELLRR